jgi:hypothetical protein
MFDSPVLGGSISPSEKMTMEVHGSEERMITIRPLSTHAVVLNGLEQLVGPVVRPFSTYCRTVLSTGTTRICCAKQDAGLESSNLKLTFKPMTIIRPYNQQTIIAIIIS